MKTHTIIVQKDIPCITFNGIVKPYSGFLPKGMDYEICNIKSEFLNKNLVMSFDLYDDEGFICKKSISLRDFNDNLYHMLDK